MRIFLRVLMLAVIFSANATAHEGHDHGPSTIQAPKGGVVRSLETVHLELLVNGKNLKIYPYGTDLKPSSPAKFPASLTVALPRKNATPLQLHPKSDHWETSFDAKGAHRFTIELTIQQGGHSDKVSWTVEPKRN